MFVFKGVSSDDMEVVLKEDDSLLGRAAQKFSQIDIDGGNEPYFEELGYAVIEKTMELQVLNLEKMDLILSWLNGVGILEYNNRITTARFYEEIVPQRSASIEILSVPFIRAPFWNKKNDEFVQATNSIINSGTIFSEPIIKLKRKTADKVDITINDVRFSYTFNNEEYVEIDCEKGKVTYENLNRNRQIEMDYKYPTLNVGENKIITHLGDAEIYIKRKDRWL